MKHLSGIVTLCMVSVSANAALIDRGGGLIYDTDRNITWLANANYGAGSSFDDGFSSSDGLMTWQSAVNWAADLSYDDTVRGVTYADWRLPATPASPDNTCTIPGPEFGTGCTGSELGHMYNTELGGTVTDPATPTGSPPQGPFTNVQGDGYWSGTSFDATNAYVLNLGFAGQQAADQKILGYYGWAVRDGDVSAVPAPGAIWLLGTGLLGMLRWSKRRRVAT